MSKMQGKSPQGRSRRQGSEKNTNPRRGRTRAAGKVIKKSSDKEFKNTESKPRTGKPAKPSAQTSSRKEGSLGTPPKLGAKSKPSFGGRGKADGDSQKQFSEKKTASKPAVTPKPKKKEDADGGIRLNKYIANSGMCSRREADVFIQNGVVTVNGKMVDEPGYKVQPGDLVKFDGRTIIPEKPVYLLLNKPKDFITTSEDPQGRRTVMTLIEGACKERVFPVGRLDRNTTGLLLFTNDGEMAEKLTHPRKRVKKIYLAELDKNLKTEHLRQLREGITLEDGFIKPDAVEYAAGPKPGKKTIGIEIHSGRNRIVRRMFEHFGYKVVKLDRVYFAGLTKKNLPRGRYRMLDPLEINMLKML
jgi:23S rRNA pseudouridine2605 synthase